MSAFGFDPENILRRRRPRVVTPRRHSRGRRIALILIAVIVVIVVVGGWLLRLRVDYLFLHTLGHDNVFWTPFVAQVVLFLIGLAITGGVVALSVPLWIRAARCLDVRGGRVAFWAGPALALVAGIIGGSAIAGDWQQFLLWQHGHSFNATDPAFGADYSFFLFTLPVIDAISALFWGAAIVSLLATLAIGALAMNIVNFPENADLPLKPPEGSTPEQALRVSAVHAGICLVAIFILAAFGAHFGVYHLATSSHDPNFIGLDASQRNVVRPILGALQVIAAVFAVLAAVIVWLRRRRRAVGTGIALGALLATWLVVAGILQTVPSAIYQATSVNPNAVSAQSGPISDYLATSRYAWALQNAGSNPDVVVRSFGNPSAPALTDLVNDPGTLVNIRVQDYRQLKDVFEQIDRSRAYQTYPTITVDRYPDAKGNETEVMLGPREISESDIPNATFVNQTFIYTHGYGITAASVNKVGDEGKPYLYTGHQPLTQIANDAPPALSFNGTGGDPRIYCGLSTSQNVVVNSTQQEFDYPSGSGDKFNAAGSGMAGIPVDNTVDRLALSLNSFGGFNLFLTNYLTPQSVALLHRTIADRVQTLAPFLTVDGDPYIVADTSSGHLVYIVDAYVKSSLFPESYQIDDGTSYMRNAVKAVVDARTCQTTLYAVDPSEPLTATWADIYPGLMRPLSEMPDSLKQHLRYPEDLFQNQANVYAWVHVTDPTVYFNKSDIYHLSEEYVNGQQQTTQAYYVEMTLPGDTKPSFVLLQTFSPGASGGSGSTANNMTAWLAAKSDYANTAHPELVAVPLNNADNVLGPLQFDNNINTDPLVSQQITLLGQHGSQVILGNVIVLPFGNHSFLYVRPFYVLAAGTGAGSFPQLRFVIVGTQNQVAYGSDLTAALQKLFNTTQPIPGLGTPAPTPSGTPGGTPGASPTPLPSGTIPVSQQVIALLNDLLQHEANAEAAYQRGDYATAGAEQAKVKQDADQLRQLLSQQGGSASPSPTP